MTTSLDVLALIDPPVPESLIRRVASGEAPGPPATPRLSASAVLLRDGADGLETFLLHRHDRMAFAPSMVVFPGGAVELADEVTLDPRRACAVRETREETGVELAEADLHPWAHWTTPVPEPRRYDTYFYVAELPAGQSAYDASTETRAANWRRPTYALADYVAGAMQLMPPTLSILTELADLPDVAAVTAAARGRLVLPVLPEVVSDGDSWRFRYPVAP